METKIAHQFSTTAAPYEVFAKGGDFAYDLRKKLNEGGTMTRQEKDSLTRRVREDNIFGGGHAIAVGGWLFDFTDVLTKYLVKQYGQWYERYACDKTALRKNTYGAIEQIVAL